MGFWHVCILRNSTKKIHTMFALCTRKQPRNLSPDCQTFHITFTNKKSNARRLIRIPRTP
jgi:hypothetical protein